MTHDQLTARGFFLQPDGSWSKRPTVPSRAALPDAKQRERKETLAGGDEGEAPCPGLRHVRFTLVRKRLLDVDAKYASTKDILDFLATCGVIRGDKEGEITLEVNQRRIIKGESENTVIEVFENK